MQNDNKPRSGEWQMATARTSVSIYMDNSENGKNNNTNCKLNSKRRGVTIVIHKNQNNKVISMKSQNIDLFKGAKDRFLSDTLDSIAANRTRKHRSVWSSSSVSSPASQLDRVTRDYIQTHLLFTCSHSCPPPSTGGILTLAKSCDCKVKRVA